MPSLPRTSLLCKAGLRAIGRATMVPLQSHALAPVFSRIPSEPLPFEKNASTKNLRAVKSVVGWQLGAFLSDRRLLARELRAGWNKSPPCELEVGNGNSMDRLLQQSYSPNAGVRMVQAYRGAPITMSGNHLVKNTHGMAHLSSTQGPSYSEEDVPGVNSVSNIPMAIENVEKDGSSGALTEGEGRGDSVLAQDTLSLDKESESGATSSEMDATGRARRRRAVGANATRQTQGPLPDLLTVPGIGPRNMEKLVAKGIAKLAELKQLYRDNFRDNGSDKMVEYLQSSIGILHKHHAASITNFIKHTVDAELAVNEEGSHRKKRLTFCVEGNISVGKSTFLQKIANETIELRDMVEIVPEPVAKWQDVGPDHFNILESFYAEPERYAYTFQNYVFVTRLMQERESANGVKPLRLMERSVFSDRMVFVRAVHEAKWMNEMEISIYDSWFNPVVSELPGLVPDAFIYLRASPDTCLRRLQSRKRPEEQGVSLEYLRGLHEKHEQWLLPAKSSSGVLSVSPALKEPLSARIRDRVFYLEGDHVHSCIQKVPALLLDCDATIDFSRDFEAKAEYARQVADFFEYVQRTKNSQASEKVTGGGSQLVLPLSGGLLGPDGSQLFGGNPLDAVDFRRRVSSFCT